MRGLGGRHKRVSLHGFKPRRRIPRGHVVHKRPHDPHKRVVTIQVLIHKLLLLLFLAVAIFAVAVFVFVMKLLRGLSPDRRVLVVRPKPSSLSMEPLTLVERPTVPPRCRIAQVMGSVRRRLKANGEPDLSINSWFADEIHRRNIREMELERQHPGDPAFQLRTVSVHETPEGQQVGLARTLIQPPERRELDRCADHGPLEMQMDHHRNPPPRVVTRRPYQPRQHHQHHRHHQHHQHHRHHRRTNRQPRGFYS